MKNKTRRDETLIEIRVGFGRGELKYMNAKLRPITPRDVLYPTLSV
jgi:hypothetical protein